MADNKQAGAAVGSGPTFATDEIAGVDYPRTKIVWGVDGVATDASASNPLPVVQTGTPGLPTGAATAAKQPALGTAGTASADVITVQGIASGTALAVSAASLPLPSGAATEATLAAASAKLPATLGQKAMTASMAVALASDQSAIPVTGTFYQATQPVSAASLPLPTGAATLAEQQTQTTSLQLLDNLVLAEDAVAASGDPGIQMLAVRRDTPSSGGADGDYAALSLDSTGALRVTGGGGGTQYAEDAAHSSGDTGTMALGVRRDANTSLVGTDGDYAPFQLDASGSLKVAIISGAGSGGTSATDDGAFSVGSGSGTPIMGLADETTPDSVDEGDVGVVRMTLSRALHVNLRDSSGTELTAGAQYAEDAVHASGDMLTMAGAVRRDTAASSSGTNGDNSTLNVDANGKLWVNAEVTAALPAGTNAIGKLAANSGVDIGDVDILSIAAGDNNIGNVDIVTMPNVTLAAGTNTNEVVGDAAHDAAIAGNPVRAGGRARTSDYTSVANDDTADFITDVSGKQVVLPYAIPENFVSGAITTAMTGTTSTSLVAAPAAGLRNYITTIIVSNAHATVGTDVIIQDGSGGTTLLTIPAAAVYGGAVITLPTPLRQPTTATAIFCANVTTGASTKVSAVGYKAP